jgi:hypothetical protein
MLSIVGVLTAGCNNVGTEAGAKAVGITVGAGVGVTIGRNSLIRGHIGNMITKTNNRIPIPTCTRRRIFPMTVSASHLIFIYQRENPSAKSNKP